MDLARHKSVSIKQRIIIRSFANESKIVSQLYDEAKPDGLCNIRTLLLSRERRRRFNAGGSDYNDVKDLDAAKSEDKVALMEHLKILITNVEGQYGIITEEDLRVWTLHSPDVIRELKFLLNPSTEFLC